MATWTRPQRRINSPGVQIDEIDLSQYSQPNVGTNIFVAGFAAQGPTDEVIAITSNSELEAVYGVPQTPAERYFYHSCKEILGTDGNLITTRLPYGSGQGTGFATAYTGLFYPVLSSGTLTTISSGVSAFVNVKYEIGAPKQINLSDDQYNDIVQYNTTWGSISSASLAPNLSANENGSTNLLNTGIIVLNTAKTTINEAYEGYYVTFADNTNFGPDSNYDAVKALYSLSSENIFVKLPESRLGFQLSATNLAGGDDSVSEVIEKAVTYNFGDSFYKDSVIVNVFRVRNSIYEPQTLVYGIAESFVGSFDSNKKTIADQGGTPRTFFLENIVNAQSNNIKMFINPALTELTNWTSTLSSNVPAIAVNVREDNKAVYPLGTYSPTYSFEKGKDVGSVVTKLTRALTLVETAEIIDLDVVVDAGLSTIHANKQTGGDGSEYYDDRTFHNPTNINNDINDWKGVFNVFNKFVKETRKDCVFISDPLRQIFVNGEDTKTLSLKTSNFTTQIYTPLKNSYGVSTNYSAAYANWIKVYDEYLDKRIWVPASGFVAAVYARSDSQTQKWYAPAGLTRGVINNAIDLAINPNQKQRDNLYTIAINPIVFFPGDGFVVFGQKTLQNKPTAFDRVNVRRLFLALEKATLKALKYFVFEPNTEFTRSRLKATITPIFELAKNTEGVYDYLIVCDERNNTPDTIDRNELLVDIYIKPVKAAEFILVNFIATRTGQNFEELL